LPNFLKSSEKAAVPWGAPHEFAGGRIQAEGPVCFVNVLLGHPTPQLCLRIVRRRLGPRDKTPEESASWTRLPHTVRARFSKAKTQIKRLLDGKSGTRAVVRGGSQPVSGQPAGTSGRFRPAHRNLAFLKIFPWEIVIQDISPTVSLSGFVTRSNFHPPAQGRHL